MEQHLPSILNKNLEKVLTIGLNHEKQHHELLITDIKYILGHNPLLSTYVYFQGHKTTKQSAEWLTISWGQYDIGFDGELFSFDNEFSQHTVFI